MEEQLVKILKQFKLIRPDEGFIKYSRQNILSSPQLRKGILGFRSNVFESFKLATAIALASALLFVFLGGLSYFNVKNLTPVLLTSLNDENLKAEEAKLDLQIQLGELTYDLGQEKEIGAKIDELLKNLSL